MSAHKSPKDQRIGSNQQQQQHLASSPTDVHSRRRGRSAANGDDKRSLTQRATSLFTRRSVFIASLGALAAAILVSLVLPDSSFLVAIAPRASALLSTFWPATSLCNISNTISSFLPSSLRHLQHCQQYRSRNMTPIHAKEERELLPATVTPRHYDLTMEPDLTALVYDGQVTIQLDINEAVSQIVLHATHIEFREALLVLGDDTEPIKVTDFALNKDSETVTLSLSREAPANSKGALTIKFSGTLNDEMVGFYRSSFKDAQGNSKNIATTQFEPTCARRAFPCFDEPMLKATFDVTLVVPKELTALSNMDVKETIPDASGKVHVRFNTTPLMSTYLLAFIVGEFDYVEAFTSGEHNGRPIKCRVYTQPGDSEKGRFALEVATRALEFFAHEFGIAYPLPKLDQVAIPDFEAGAMENWGLVTYRTITLLFDPKQSRSKAKEYVSYVVCHELAHQWFGNLVTMEWWSELWLNEGFATWVGTHATNYLFPEWNVWTTFISDDFNRALQLDSKRSSHPIQVPVPRSSQIMQIFDAISYSKGASVIRMLSSYIGLETFLKGIRQYLAKHQYRNAATTDLWAALSEASGRDIGEFMAQWTLRVGYPVLTVTEEAVGGEGSDEVKVHVRQNRFLVSGTVTSEEDQNVWWVPLNFATNDPDFEAKSGSAVLTEREASFSLPKGVAGDNGWYKLNKDTVSLFRVQYSDVAIKRLAKAIENKALSTNDRIGIFSDLSALAESGLGKTSAMLTLIKSNADECQDEVWGTIQESLGRLTRAWIDQPSEIYDKIQALKRELFGPLVRRLGYEVKRDEDNKITRLRSRAIISAGIAGDKEIIGKVREWLDSVSAGTKPSPVHADLLEPMFIVAVNQGGEREYEVVKTYYLDEKNPIDQRLVALQALGATKVPSLMDATLKFLLSDAVRNQDIHTGIARLTMTPEGRDKLWDWFKASYDNFLKRYGDSMSYMSVLVRYTMMGFSSEEKASEVEQFFADKDVSRIDRALNQSLETIRTYAKWVERDSEDVKQWLNENIN